MISISSANGVPQIGHCPDDDDGDDDGGGGGGNDNTGVDFSLVVGLDKADGLVDVLDEMLDKDFIANVVSLLFTDGEDLFSIS